MSRFGVNELMKAWSNGLPLTDKRVSPLYGELKGLPPVYMYGGGKEMEIGHEVVCTFIRRQWAVH